VGVANLNIVTLYSSILRENIENFLKRKTFNLWKIEIPAFKLLLFTCNVFLTYGFKITVALYHLLEFLFLDIRSVEIKLRKFRYREVLGDKNVKTIK
jgi:hypothetical protein